MKVVLIIFAVCTLVLTACNTANKVSETQEGSLNHPDSLFLYMVKTSCYGKCPAYKININHNGVAILEGKSDVPFIGKHTTRLSEEQINSIKDSIYAIQYFSFEKIYDSRITDIPSTITEIHLDGKIHRVKNRHQGPVKLDQFERWLHEEFMKMNWEKVDQQ